MQLAQDITVVVAELSDVLGHPNGTPSNVISLPATVVANLSYFAAGNQCNFVSSFDHLEIGQLPTLPPGLDPEKIKQQFQQFVSSLTPNQTVSFNVAALANDANVNVENAGLSVDSGLSRLAFRAEVGPSSLLAAQAWGSFYNGNVSDRLLGADWGYFIDKDMLDALISFKIATALASGDTGDFQPVTGVGSVYSNAGGNVHVTSTFSGNVDAKICSVWTDVTLDWNLSAGGPNTVTSDMNLSWHTSNDACSVTAAILGAALGGVVDLLNVPVVDGILNPITGFMAGIATVMYLANTLNPPGLPIKDCKQLSDTHYACKLRLNMNQVSQFGQLSLNSVNALDDGISLTGIMKPVPLTTAIVQPSAGTFGWIPPGISCGEISGGEVAQFRKDPTKFVTLHTEVTLADAGTAPLYFCDFSVVNDPLGVFPASDIQVLDQQAPISLSINIPYPGAEYFAAPYPCQLLVTTSGGTRLISIPPAPPLTQQDINNLANALADQIGGCQKLVNSWFTQVGIFNPAWGPDPPPDQIVDHLWQVEVLGLSTGETATLLDATRRPLVTGVATTGATMQLSALVQPAAASEVGLLRGLSGAAGGAAPGLGQAATNPNQTPGIGIIQQLILRRANIPLLAPCQRIATAYLDGEPAVVALLQDSIMAFGLSTLSRPTLMASWPVPGLNGTIAWRDGLLGFGSEGFVTVTTHRVLRPDCCSRTGAISDAIAGPGVLYALGINGLQIYSPSLQLVGEVPLAAGGHLLRIGGALIVAGVAGLTIFDITQPLSPREVATRGGLNVTDLVSPPDVGGRFVVALLATGPAQLFELAADGTLNPRATYPQLPWFAGTARLADLLVRLGPGNTTIQVSAFGQSKKM